jgi:hypothetical protein
MKTLIAAATLLALAAPAQAQANFDLLNDVQSTINEILAWAQAGNSEKTCKALAKAEALAPKLNDGIALEASIKAQVASMRAFTQRIGVYCAFDY